MYLKVEGNTLLTPTGGKGSKKVYPTIEAKLTEQPPEHFKEVAISRDARGNYYASFSYQGEAEEHQAGQTVAFDRGIKTLATGVNEQGRVYRIGGFKGVNGITANSTKSGQSGTNAKRSLVDTSI